MKGLVTRNTPVKYESPIIVHTCTCKLWPRFKVFVYGWRQQQQRCQHLSYDKSSSDFCHGKLNNNQHFSGCPGSNTGGAIYFSAAVTDSRTTSKRDQVLLFPNVITNEGGAFSAGNGTFTCPQDGAYHFSYGYLTRQTQPKAVYVALRVNGQVKAWAYTQGTSFHESAAKSIVLPLKKGDYVQCVAQEKGTTLNAGPYTTFSGFKIQWYCYWTE